MQLISVKLLVLLMKKTTCLVVVFDRPCSKFVVLLLFRLYSCTFVNVDAVNGMSFTLFSGRKGKNVHFDVCIFISPSPLNIMYTVLFHSSVILKKILAIWHVFFFPFLFLIRYRKKACLYLYQSCNIYC